MILTFLRGNVVFFLANRAEFYGLNTPYFHVYSLYPQGVNDSKLHVK